MTDWRQLFENAYKGVPNARPVDRPAAGPLELRALEAVLKARLPGSLRELLSQTNGVVEQTKFATRGFDDSKWLIMPCVRMKECNLLLRESMEKAGVGHLIVIADNDESYFAMEPGVDDGPVMEWTQIAGLLVQKASSLAEFVGLRGRRWVS